MMAEDATWLNNALAAWQHISRKRLLLQPAPLPLILTFDAQCAFTARRVDGKLSWAAVRHSGTIKLPDGKEIPADIASFAAPFDANSGAKGFFVMALPSIWAAKNIQSGLGVSGLTTGVLLHEIMHSWQFDYINPTIAELKARYRLDDSISDNSLQESFEKVPAYVADYEAERDLLFAAAAAQSKDEARAFAAQALRQMRARHLQWFEGSNAKWKSLDDLFLTLEGAGQWAFYAWASDRQGLHLDRATALREVRRGGRYWSQDEGLALFLTIDRLVPGWQKMVFSKKSITAESLLTLAST